MSKTTHNTLRIAKNHSIFETLEGREMYSASTPAGYQAYVAGRQLEIMTSGTNEQITISQTKSRVIVNDDAGARSFRGKFRSIDILADGDTVVIDPTVTTPAMLMCDTGDNTLITASRNDTLMAGPGNDDLVAIAGKHNTLMSGGGDDNIWTNGSNVVMPSPSTVVHTVKSFIDTNQTSFNCSAIAEPKADTDPSAGTMDSYFDASGNPLFGSDGPSMDDIVQGAAGDCYFISSLSAVAAQSPQSIRNMITPLGDGTYAVEFNNNGKPSYIREDANLPMTSDGYLLYCDVGHSDNSAWAPLIEKAWAYERPMLQGQAPGYAATEDGEGEEGLLAIGGKNMDYSDDPAKDFTSSADEANWIDQHMSNGDAVVIGTDDTGIDNVLITDHEYTVASVQHDNSGNITGIWLRNPWGQDVANGLAADGHNDGSNDGYVFVTTDELYGCCNNVAAGTFAS